MAEVSLKGGFLVASVIILSLFLFISDPVGVTAAAPPSINRVQGYDPNKQCPGGGTECRYTNDIAQAGKYLVIWGSFENSNPSAIENRVRIGTTIYTPDYESSNQINVLLPDNVAKGSSILVQVINSGIESNVASVTILSSAGNLPYSPTIRFEVPVKNQTTRDLGLFVINDSMNLNFNLTFDYPFPLGENETNVTAEIRDESGVIQFNKTIPLKAYLEKYGIVKDGNYVFNPMYFNFSVDVKGRNVSSTAISFTYTVHQYQRKPYPREGGDNNNKWNISGRFITGAGGAALANYCSGPWDFDESMDADAIVDCEGNKIGIQRGTPATDKLQSYQTSGPILYFMLGTNDKIPSTPGSGAISFGAWKAAYSWKFKTFVYPTQDYGGRFNISADSGVRVIITDMSDNSIQQQKCHNTNPRSRIDECLMDYSFRKNRWYHIDVYLYNDPGGDEDTNPAGVRIEDVSSRGMSILELIGGEASGAVMNGESPGGDDKTISASRTIFAGGQESLSTAQDFTMFSTDHVDVSCDNKDVICSLRMACGNSYYNGLKTDNYGWILNHRISPGSWEPVGNDPTVREGSITNKDGTKIDFDRTSIEDGCLRARYTANSGNERPIGGIYRCKKENDWPDFVWEKDCPDPNRRYNYTEGSQFNRCCYVNVYREEIIAHSTYNYGSINVEKDYTVKIRDFDPSYNYIINFLPPYAYAYANRDCGNTPPDSWYVGDKLCVIPNPTSYEAYQIKTLYLSNYTNKLCNQKTGSRCCYCRPGWGCKLDCVNELNTIASDKFTLPFPLSYKQVWALRDVGLDLTGTTDAVDLRAEGNPNDGWTIKANLSDSANLMLDKNYTIPLNLFSDFGIKAPERMGNYNVILKVNYKYAPQIQSPSYPFHAVECIREGDKRSFYDEAAYPGTKDIGLCRPGLQVCKKVGDNVMKWRYESKYDRPVYPSSETCNGLDDDCNGLIDDINGFEWIMQQIIQSGGKKTPYQVTRCGCFMGTLPKEEKCNGIDDDCDGVIDNSEAKVWINTCDSLVIACMSEGSPYLLCKKIYNSQCSLTQVTISQRGNITVNTCTEKVKTCMENKHIIYAGDTPADGSSFTYGECNSTYNSYSCLLEENKAKILEDTCRCSTSSAPQPETCNGVDDDCNGIIDDVENASTCACAMLTNITLIHRLKAVGDASCDGIDSNCNGRIDDGAINCACTGMPPGVVLNIKANVNEMCNGVDDNCNGLVDEKFPQLGRPCGLGVCAGGAYVCNVRGNETVCNTTVSPSEALFGRAIKLSSDETCDLRDNDCDGAIDEGCSCTPGGAVKVCGYQNGIYYKNREQLNQTCRQVVDQLKNLIGQSVATTEAGIYEKCTTMLGNVSSLDNNVTLTILSLCDSLRICSKTDFPIKPVSECTFGVQNCTGGQWGNCTAVIPKTEICNGKDDDCNGIIDDVAIPSICACYNGTHAPGELGEACNGIDDNCNGIVDDVGGGNSVNLTHCGCFNQIVNITQRRAEVDISCNGVDDNCNGVIDEGLDNCACRGTVFEPNNNTWAQAISAEKCNGIDDDCDGVIDEPWRQGGSSATASQYLGAPCGPLNSRCVGGTYVCSNNGNGIVCSTMYNEGLSGQDLRVPEVCNGIDDDCNGKIDDVQGDTSGRFCQCYNGVPSGSEICDGKDNDCDGLVDDGLTNCGCSFDMMLNASNINQLAALINAKKSSAEICNNMDDNCNNQTDEGLGDKCFCGGGFPGNPAMKPEFCNGVDDDCNGIIDDVVHNETCACYNGAHQPGQFNETCNGIDDNCNGLADENWPTLGGSCGIGACAGGAYECSNDGNGVVCSTGPDGSQNKFQSELCDDEIDNDCDGAINEGCACETAGVGAKKNCSTSVGECRQGIQTCTSSGWSGCIGGVLPSPEICDGKDNDCDGVIDNVPNPSACACANGAHTAGQLQETCNGVDDDCNGIVDDLEGKNSVEATKCGCFNNAYAKGAKMEACNNIDDDCNGVTDDIKGGNSVASTKCGCYGGAAPGTESCNSIDDNCNGLIDESWPNLGQTCGQGICTGVLACSQNGQNAECNGAQPETEICDGKDNDCDGTIDEGCFGSQTSSCQNGIQDGDEEGIDCGGSCPAPCTKTPTAPPLPPGSWMLVFAVLVVIIVIVGIALLFLKPSKPV